MEAVVSHHFSKTVRGMVKFTPPCHLGREEMKKDPSPMTKNNLSGTLRVMRLVGIVLLALLLLYAAGRLIQLNYDRFYSGERAPYLQLPAPDAMTLRWQTAEATLAQVRYGTAPHHLDKNYQGRQVTRQHEIRLSGLQAATRYYYLIEVDGKVLYGGEDYWFVTPALTGRDVPLRFVVLGDPGYANPMQQSVHDAIDVWLTRHPDGRSAPLDFILTTGDNAYRSGSNSQFQSGFFQPYENWLRHYPVWPVYGNHDARRRVFFDLFSLPTRGESGGLPSATEHYYAFDDGPLHVVMLDSQASDMSKGSNMLRWLRSDLKQTRQPWIIALFHHPPYTKGSHDSDWRRDSHGRMFEVRENVLPILEQSGVDLVLSGHSHVYERSHLMGCHTGRSDKFRPSMRQAPMLQGGKMIYRKSTQRAAYTGTIYTVIGSSSKLNDGPLDHPAHAVSLKQMGALVVTIKSMTLYANFINKNGIVDDTYVIQKGGSNENFFRCRS